MFKLFKKSAAVLLAVGIMSSAMTAYAAEDNAAAESSLDQIVDDIVDDVIDGGELAEEAEEDAAGESSTEPVYVTNVNEAKNGVVQVNYVYVDDNEKSHIVKGGTGFLIGYPDKTEYVLTCAHTLELTSEQKKAAFKYLKVPKDKYDDVNLEIEVVVENDVTTSATLVSKSDELDLAVLSLSQAIHTRTPLSIRTSESGKASDLPYEVADRVYSLGFPDEIIFKTNEKCYSNDRVVMSSGDIVNLTTINDIQTIQHSAEVGNNNCGGPLIDAEGNVIGINSLSADGKYFCAVDSTVLVKLLDALGLEYSKTYKIEEEPVVEEVTASIEASTQTTVVETQIEKVVPVWMIVLLIIFGILLVAAIVAVVFLLIRKKKDNSSDDKEDSKVETKSPSKSLHMPKASTPSPSFISSNGSGRIGGNDTGAIGLSVEVPDIKGTTVLAQSEEVPKPKLISGTLIRKRDMKQILIDKEEFFIGKDPLHVSFCINDNGAISRTHAIIRTDVSGVFIEDCNSTNGTFVNGRKIPAGQPVQLANGDVVKLANEEFDFKI